MLCLGTDSKLILLFIYLTLIGAPLSGGGQFDPFNQGRLPAPPLEVKNEERY